MLWRETCRLNRVKGDSILIKVQRLLQILTASAILVTFQPSHHIVMDIVSGINSQQPTASILIASLAMIDLTIEEAVLGHLGQLQILLNVVTGFAIILPVWIHEDAMRLMIKLLPLLIASRL